MATLSYRTAGESHGKALIALIEGMPAGVPLDKSFIDAELRRRQGGYGRGGRQKIETDAVDFLTGVRMGHSIGSPITLLIANKDFRLDDPAATPPRQAADLSHPPESKANFADCSTGFPPALIPVIRTA